VGGSYKRTGFGGDEKCIQNFSRYVEGKGHMVYLGIDGRLVLNWILNK
jgi:hypothetical protein